MKSPQVSPDAQSEFFEQAVFAWRDVAAGQTPLAGHAAPVLQQVEPDVQGTAPSLAQAPAVGTQADGGAGIVGYGDFEQRLLVPVGTVRQSSRQVMNPNCFTTGSVLQRPGAPSGLALPLGSVMKL